MNQDFFAVRTGLEPIIYYNIINTQVSTNKQFNASI